MEHRTCLRINAGLTMRLAATLVVLLSAVPGTAADGLAQDLRTGSLLVRDPIKGEGAFATLSRGALDEVRAHDGKVVIERFPLNERQSVDLEVQQFQVTRPDTRFVLGRKNGPDLALPFNPGRVTLFRGKVAGEDDSHVFLALAGGQSVGLIERGEERYELSAKDTAGRLLPAGRIRIARQVSHSGFVPDVPPCGIDVLPLEQLRGQLRPRGTTPLDHPRPGPKFFELAVDTDFEFFQIFGNTEDAEDYMLTLIGAVSDIYMRELNTHIVITYVRLWDDPDDLYNEPEPFFVFGDNWAQNLTQVPRDVAMFLTGRRNLAYGGVAWLPGLCDNDYGYCVVGYIRGQFYSSTVPNRGNWDLTVVAHELGHICGAPHTHDTWFYNPPADQCYDDSGPLISMRGTIMSYCHLHPGTDSNIDMRFHAFSRTDMEYLFQYVDCVTFDCNNNAIDDATDIAEASSQDVDGDGVPDECEDCNNNAILDSYDIANATSADLNSNGFPDECEPDCNLNGLPDSIDIQADPSLDQDGNAVPDTCQRDCNVNAMSDYNEIQIDMSLDIDRNAVLDACQDCDGDGTADFDALSGAHNLWVTSSTLTGLQSYFGASGVNVRSSATGVVASGLDLIATRTGGTTELLVADGPNNRVVRFDGHTGNLIGVFVAAGDGGLEYPAGLAIGPNGNLFVSSRDTHSVLEFDGATGAFVTTFVAEQAGGLAQPYGLTFGPNRNLFVCSDDNRILEYNGLTGAFIRAFVAEGAGGLSGPRGLVFNHSGNLLVTGFFSQSIHAYSGRTGNALGAFNVGPGEGHYPFWGIRIGPNGNVFAGVRRPGSAAIMEFDFRNGYSQGSLVARDSTLRNPTGFDFMPGWQVDCNVNFIPDSCDISSGASLDVHPDGMGDGIPDECQADCNDNGVLDRFDVIPYGTSPDCNGNRVPDECEIAADTDLDLNGNGLLDECEGSSDLDGDGCVDQFDFAIFVRDFTGPGCDGGSSPADISRDGCVDLVDFSLFQAAYTGPDCPISSINLDMVEIPGGGIGPAYGYLISRYEITVAQFVEFLNDAEAHPDEPPGRYLKFYPDGDIGIEGGLENSVFSLSNNALTNGSFSIDFDNGIRYRNPEEPSIPGSNYTLADPDRANHPVVGVTWLGALKFCNWRTLKAGLGESQRVYTEGPYPGDWHPVTISTLDWWGTENTADNYFPLQSARDLNRDERVDLVCNYRGYRLPMDNVGFLIFYLNQPQNEFNEWYKVAAFDSAAPDMPRTGPHGEMVAGDHWFYGFGRDALTPLDANYYDSGDPFDNGSTPADYYNGVNTVALPEMGDVPTTDTGNPYHLYGLTGNVWEWGQDYANSIYFRALHGGSWYFGFDGTASTARMVSYPDSSSAAIGFRVVRVPQEPDAPGLCPE